MRERASRGRLFRYPTPRGALSALLSLALLLHWSFAAAQPNGAEPTAAPARATTPAPTTQPLAEALRGMARADYAAARILYEDGDYAGAFTKLESAYLSSKDPRLLWNMAACEKALRHYANVIALLERYLVEGSTLVSDEERLATHELVQTVQAFVNELSLRVVPDGVDVWIDGVKVATTPLATPLRLDMGRRRLELQKAGFIPHRAEIDLAGGKSLTLEVALKPEVHEGTLRIVSDPSAVIRIDGRVVGTGSWAGQLPSGPHSVHVSAVGKEEHQTEVVIKDADTSSLHVNLLTKAAPLQPASGSGAWWWVLGGVAVAGASVGTYMLLRPDDEPRQPELGTWGGFEL